MPKINQIIMIKLEYTRQYKNTIIHITKNIKNPIKFYSKNNKTCAI